jgi:hypothetical protein
MRIGASESNLIVKDSWQHKSRASEGELLEEAKLKGVDNVARCYYHEIVQVDGCDDDVAGAIRGGPRKMISTAGPHSRKRRANSALPPKEKRARVMTRSMSKADEEEKNLVQGATDEESKNLEQSENRVHRRVVIQNIGKPLLQASSRVAVLRGLLGGLKGQQHVQDDPHTIELTFYRSQLSKE